MKHSENNWAVGMVHELCPICCQKTNEQIIIPKTLSKKTKKDIEEAHGKAIGFSEEACKDCSEYLSKDFIALIEIDPEKSNMSQLHTIYRTGNVAWLRKAVAKDMFKDFIIKDMFAFLDQESLQKLASMVQEN